MPTLLPRKPMDATSVIPASIQRPSPSDHRVGFSNSFTRLRLGSLALRPALSLFGNSRQRVTTMPLPHTTGAYGQLPRRDLNPLDLLLLLRTARLKLLFPPRNMKPTFCICYPFYPVFLFGTIPPFWPPQTTALPVLQDIRPCWSSGWQFHQTARTMRKFTHSAQIIH